MLKGLLRQEGFCVGRLHVATLMKTMGIAAIYRRTNTSKPHPDHKIYPYLQRNMAVTRPNQVWAMDITYVPLSAIACNHLPVKGKPRFASKRWRTPWRTTASIACFAAMRLWPPIFAHR